jgi:hypothetical protein
MSQQQLAPPVPPAVQLKQVIPGHGLAIASLVTGIVGVVAGLIPILGFIALSCGVVALVLGLIARKKGKLVSVKQGRAGAILGAIAIALGIAGFVIVNNAVHKLDHDLKHLQHQSATFRPSTPSTDSTASR